MKAYYFGVEIELIGEPHRVRDPLVRRVYYEKLAASLEKIGLSAEADTLNESYRKHDELYDSSCPPAVPLEAVSPIMSSGNEWEHDIDLFWQAWSKVFHMPIASGRCGCHVHVSPEPNKSFDLPELRAVAFGVVFYEQSVVQILPSYRRDNNYCKANSSYAIILGIYMFGQSDYLSLWEEIERLESKEEIRGLMQHCKGSRLDRFVLWNFDNVLPGKSGSVEFRGGRGLRGPVRTKRWVAFVLAFIHLCITRDFPSWNDSKLQSPPTVDHFWRDLRKAAGLIAVRSELPKEWANMTEASSASSSSYDDEESRAYSSDGGSTIASKGDSTYSDSDAPAYDYDEEKWGGLQHAYRPRSREGCAVM